MKVLWQCYSHISPLQQLEFSEKGEDMGEKFSIERKTNKVLSFNESLCILTDPALLSPQSRIPEWQFILQNWEPHHWFTQTGLGWTPPPTASWCPAWRLVTRAPGIVEWMEGTSRLRRTISKSQVMSRHQHSGFEANI